MKTTYMEVDQEYSYVGVLRQFSLSTLGINGTRFKTKFLNINE